jgi:hypothetical protein
MYELAATAKAGATDTVPVPRGENTAVTLIEPPVALATIMDLTIAVVAAGTVKIFSVAAPVKAL